MSIQADIDAAVGAFVEDLADLVRRAALEAVRDALRAEPPMKASAPRAAAPSKPKPRAVWSSTGPRSTSGAAPGQAGRSTGTRPKPRTAKPVEPAPRVTHAEPAAEPEPVKPRRSLHQRRGRLIVVPSSPPPAPRPAEEPVVAETSATVTPPSEPPSPRNWVVKRRPARNGNGQTNGAEANGAPAAENDAAAPPSASVPAEAAAAAPAESA